MLVAAAFVQHRIIHMDKSVCQKRSCQLLRAVDYCLILCLSIFKNIHAVRIYEITAKEYLP